MLVAGESGNRGIVDGGGPASHAGLLGLSTHKKAARQVGLSNITSQGPGRAKLIGRGSEING